MIDTEFSRKIIATRQPLLKKNALFKKGSTEGGFVSVCSVEELLSEQEGF